VSHSNLGVRLVAARIGADIAGVDVGADLDDATVGQIRAVLPRRANTAAHEDMPPELRTLAESLQAVYTNRFDYSVPRNDEPSAELRAYARQFQSVRFETALPVVRVHPETGERALLLGGSPRRLHRVTIADDLPYGVAGLASKSLIGNSAAYTPAAA